MAAAGDTYTPEIWARESLLFLTERLEMVPLVKQDFRDEIAQFGDTVNTRKRNVMTARTWTGSGESQGSFSCSTAECMTVEIPSSVNCPVVLDTMKYTAFMLEDREVSVSIPEFQTDFIEPATYPLAEAIDSSLVTAFLSGSDVDGGTVSAGGDNSTGDGAALDQADFVYAKKQLDDGKAPRDLRRIVLSTEHEYDMGKISTLYKVNEGGTNMVQQEGRMNRLYGFDLYSSQNIPDYTGYATIGDIPQSIAFHRDACALISRPLPTIPDGYGGTSDVANYGNVSMRVTFAWETMYKAVVVSFDVLYGVKLLENALAFIIRP